MIPAAYYFVDEKLERYENYSSTLSEYFTLDEIHKLDEDNHKMIKNAACIINLFFEFTYVFVIYNPNKSKMDLSQYGDFNTPKMLVDTQNKATELERYFYLFEELLSISSLATDVSEFDINNAINNNNHNDAIDTCNNSIIEYLNCMDKLIELCFSDFKKEFMF